MCCDGQDDSTVTLSSVRRKEERIPGMLPGMILGSKRAWLPEMGVEESRQQTQALVDLDDGFPSQADQSAGDAEDEGENVQD